jgi:cytochrome o ubiquinol oxidase operon protein cyoD
MSKTHSKDHGSMWSYVIGFVFSLAFTIIPYHLVVNNILTGQKLLVAILGIAIVQMFIQIFFFLHLGRGPKPFYNVVFFFATAGLIVIVVGASLFIMDNLYRTMSPQEYVLKQAQKENIAQIDGNTTGACSENKTNHSITIKDGLTSPAFIEANRCDTLTFTNNDAEMYRIHFGNHNEPTSYGGEDEVMINASESETITLNEIGTHTFYDHSAPSFNGSFTVTE